MANQNIRSVCPYCGVGCGIILQVEHNKVVKVIGDKAHPTNFGRLCTKGTTCGQAIAESGRMENAYVRQARDHDPVRLGMDKAISETARRLRQTLDTHGPDALAFYVSGQMSLESQYLINKLAKGFVRTANIESNSRLCMASAGSGYKLSLGSDGPPGSYEDFDRADLFFVIGANMADCHPILFLRMMDRVKAGAKLIVVDPRRSATADKADLFLPINPGTDLALLNGLLHLLLKNGHTDPAFIANFTEGWEAMPPFLEDYCPEHVAAITGLAEADIRQAADWIGQATEWMSCWTMGLNQSTHGTWNTNALCNLHLATGAICRTGSGPFSLTGQPNAMGGREMGYMGPGLPGQRSVLVDADRAFIENLWQIPHDSLPRQAGSGTVAMFEQMAAGRIKACWIICTNPVASVPNRQTVINGLHTAELVISQDAFLDTETNRYADILLPGALWAEAEGVMINSERNLTLMQKAVDAPGETLPDWQIIARVACEMGFAEAFTYASAAEVFEEIKQAWNPKTGYDIRGASYPRLRENPVQWPCASIKAAHRNPIRYRHGGTLTFATENGKARFFARAHMPPAEMPDDGFPFVLNTGRVQHQWHTLTKTGKIATLNRLNPGPFVELHPEDAARLGIKDKDRVEIRSRRGHAVLPAVVTDRVQPGNCFAPFHWNDVFGEHLAINAVTHDAVDPISLQPEFKCCAVALSRVELIDHQFLDLPSPVAEDTAMSRLDAFADITGIRHLSPPPLNDSERTYLAGFLSGLHTSAARQGFGVPTLPATAPLTEASRLWLNGLLAGLFSPTAPLAAPSPAVTLLWASQTGNAEALAERFAKRLRETGISVELSAMADFPASKLASTHTLALISSTFGDGDPPDNGEGFWHSLRTAETRLESLRFAVLALGDANYEQFCNHGKQLDRRLLELGATRLLERVDCDTEFEAAADAWLARFQQALNPAKPVAPATPAGKTKLYGSRLLLNRHLNPHSAHKETRQFALDLADSGLTYEAGDALGIRPRNCPELVSELLDLTRLNASTCVNIDTFGDVPLQQALTQHFEIARPSSDTLAFIAERSANPGLKHLLNPEHKAELNDWLWGRQLADVLQEYPIDCSADELLGTLKRLQPRLYSIASSAKAYPHEVHLTVAAVRYGKRKGVSSTFLADRVGDGEVPLFVQPSKHFRTPSDAEVPMIMIGPGTGIAPFRGFLQERRALGHQGRNWLFFGEQHAASDFYYQDELQGMQRDGLLTHLSLAFSRDQAQKVYVQDRIRDQGAELWRWLQDGARLYVCGDASHMAKDVDQALRLVAQTHGGLGVEGAVEYWRQMSEQKRYLRDVY
ncbi:MULTISPECIES: bifunctional nitrate reductase/sulfite reductase flavoprotein subunit alpha [unclassified Pseudomonas]|uniref:bifunctional nitrate reductase/sulfite reductase flavoprotein subunit alpha n=1 Tax=unclassified Pseudomonas TaxID=196821 RepID=UPI0008EA135C|nr:MULTISPECIES: bifunctional nitrate reductase/sulfite reductase flavoprotein subunit alpha [unclassified Pseudomonas]SFI15066.1 Molybdopterin oxidoreductase Fe4S4 domain-containing protein [Pseudomonas sp. NFPP04]SFI67102.1 Molybdopterin oxidoreductase Fe4S4 domain-containing protein [Pseudomonas sp. NFPP11]